MRKRVVAELVPFPDHSPYKIEIAFSGDPDYKESGRSLVLLQDIQYFRCVQRIGTVVERESHHVLLTAIPVDEIPHWDFWERLVCNQIQVAVQRKSALTCS